MIFNCPSKKIHLRIVFNFWTASLICSSFFAPVIFKGAVGSLKHVPSAIGEVARLPVRAYGWTRQLKEDYRTDNENKEKK